MQVCLELSPPGSSFSLHKTGCMSAREGNFFGGEEFPFSLDLKNSNSRSLRILFAKFTKIDKDKMLVSVFGSYPRADGGISVEMLNQIKSVRPVPLLSRAYPRPYC